VPTTERDDGLDKHANPYPTSAVAVQVSDPRSGWRKDAVRAVSVGECVRQSPYRSQGSWVSAGG
jgi:hypothetical protein